MTRLDHLRYFFNEDPDDPFNGYALALEIAKTDLMEGFKMLNQIIITHPKYIPSYYQAAIMAIELANPVEAKVIIETGIRYAQEENDQKALKELKQLRLDLNEDI